MGNRHTYYENYLYLWSLKLKAFARIEFSPEEGFFIFG